MIISIVFLAALALIVAGVVVIARNKIDPTTGIKTTPKRLLGIGLIILGILVALAQAGFIYLLSGLPAPFGLQKPLPTINQFYSTDGTSIYYPTACLAKAFAFDTEVCVKFSYQKINEADKASFQTIDDQGGPLAPQGYAGYAKDKNHVYLLGRTLDGVDAASFQYLGWGYSEDKNNIYSETGTHSSSGGRSTFNGLAEKTVQSFHKIDNNNGSFIVEGYLFAKDNSGVFYDGTEITGADSSSFRKFNDCYFVDNKSIYSLSTAGKGTAADISSLQTVDTSNCYLVKDKNYVYNGGNIIPNANPATFQAVNTSGGASEGITKDSSHVYFNNQIIQGADPKTFESLGFGYYRDAEHVYYKYLTSLTALVGVDAKTVKVSFTCNYLTDKNGAYYNEDKLIKLAGSDSATFHNVPNKNSCIALDKSQVYLRDKVMLPGADTATFQVLSNGNYAKDAYHVYKIYPTPSLMKGVDPQTFQPPQ